MSQISFNFQDFSNEILYRMLSNCDIATANRVAQISKRFKDFGYSEKVLCECLGIGSFKSYEAVRKAAAKINCLDFENCKNDNLKLNFALIGDPGKRALCATYCEGAVLLFLPPNAPLKIEKINTLSSKQLEILLQKSVEAKICFNDGNRSIDAQAIAQISDEKLQVLLTYFDAAKAGYRKTNWRGNYKTFDVKTINSLTVQKLASILHQKSQSLSPSS